MTDDQGPKVLASLWAMMGISLFFMTLRFFCKWRYGKVFGSDDTVLASSWMLVTAYCSLTIKTVKLGLGRHAMEIPLTQIPETLKFIWIGNLLIIAAVLTSKTSFTITLLRIAEKPWHRWIIWFTVITMYLIMGLFVILMLAQCKPISMSWNPLRSKTKCWPANIQTTAAVVAGAYSATMDFLLAACPWLIVHKLQINRREKFGVIFAMSLGFLAGVASIVKTSYLPDIAHWADITYQFSNVVIWTVAEIATTIIAASIPFLRPLVRAASKHYTSDDPQINTYRLESLAKKTAAQSQRQSKAEWTGRRRDDASDKSILGEAGMSRNVILQTQEYTVAHSRAEDEVERGGGKIGEAL